MERLTEKTIGCFKYDLKDFKHKPKEFNDYDAFYAYNMAVKKLGEYEDLEEQGLLLKLPCKVGDKAYYVHKRGIDEVEVDSFVININIFVNVSLYIGCDRFGKTLTPYKTLFFTKAEAEKALAELKENRNEKIICKRTDER